MSSRKLAAFNLSRRQIILAGCSAAALPLLQRDLVAFPSSRRHSSVNPFTLGVASGDPAADGFVIWTRLCPEPLNGGGMPPEIQEVRWEVAADDQFRSILQSGSVSATPQLGHSVHVELTGLRPDSWYWYRFMHGDAVSRTGRGRTTPAADMLPSQLRFAFASCQHYESGFFTAYQHMAEESLDLVLHLGDYIYEYAGVDGRVRRHSGPEITTLEHYRNRYAQYRTDEHLQTMHSHCPWLVVWDDHEFDNNFAGAISEEEGIDSAEFLLRRANAWQAWYEHMPVRRSCLPRGADLTLYRTIDFGRLARIEMLDTRQYRTDQPNGDRLKPLTGGALDPAGTLLGETQERWLMRELLDSTARWNVLGQQVMMGRVDRRSGPEALFSMDQWPGYEVARKRLLRFLSERRIPNPIVLTGDIHSNWVNNLQVDCDRADDAVVATEFVGTSISSGGNGKPQPADHGQLLSENPFVRFHNTERGYVSCTVTPDRWTSDYHVVEFVDRPGAPGVTRASFVVESGRPGVEG